MNRKFKRLSFVVISLFVMIGAASASDSLEISPNTQNINVGTYGYYVVTLNASENISTLNWDTQTALINASLKDGGSYATDAPAGSIGISYIGNSGPMTYDLRVMPLSGVTLHTEYNIVVAGKNVTGVAKASVSGSVVPVPEVATLGLVSAGLIGLVGLTRYRRKD
jgi:hypothetical protein